jgi:hypothetical protein
MLTESQAWRKMGNTFGEFDSGHFMCWLIEDYRTARIIGVRTYNRMMARIEAYLDGDKFAYDGSDTPSEERPYRAMAAYWLALEAEEEGR